MKKKRLSRAQKKSLHTLRNWFVLAQVRFEKCELKESRIACEMAFQLSKKLKNIEATMETISLLLRLGAEALDESAVEKWEKVLDKYMSCYPQKIPPLAWYCKGCVARFRTGSPLLPQRYFHRYLRSVHKNTDEIGYHTRNISQEERIAKAWVNLAFVFRQRNHLKRAKVVAEILLDQSFGEKKKGQQPLRTIPSMCFLLLANIAEAQKKYSESLSWLQKAHAGFLGEHNWYYYLYVLFGYARIARLQHRFSQASWYLDMIDHATSDPEFGYLKREIIREKMRLDRDSVDLVINKIDGSVQTQHSGTVSLRKQFVLLKILEALSRPHCKKNEGDQKGGQLQNPELSKAQLIEQVWQVQYQPEVHDNKLYYNINRLRKVIEPDFRKPKFLLNWKEGYCFAPGLRIQIIDSGRRDIGN